MNQFKTMGCTQTNETIKLSRNSSWCRVFLSVDSAHGRKALLEEVGEASQIPESLDVFMTDVPVKQSGEVSRKRKASNDTAGASVAGQHLAAHPTRNKKSKTNKRVDPAAHDVLCGRGAGITKHPGNKRWRELIRNNQEKYTSLPRNQRPLIAEQIVKAVRSLNPPGRFLSKDVNTQLWYEIGDAKAAEKTAQAIRDSKKLGKDQSPPSTPVTENDTVSTPSIASAQFVSPIPDSTSNIKCTPTLGRPNLNRLTTDDTFTQRMEGFTFIPPMLELEGSAVLIDLGSSTHHMMASPSVHCSPDLPKPAMIARSSTFDRASTFDRRIQQCTFTVPNLPLLAPEESGLIFAGAICLE
ncbi:Nitrilase family, member 2 [Seminavis robusta]|uniref:Nitrilase family, member 2 n=1 Tax=Seminavis robusta TaxID=568900 RepID=A0A9N8DPS7_9STRA|nr:Nitrilase family, member 2 [Seminavis robusta]|eukprot:Sro260_g101560.1 Nitrilase family, member 2 (354) ;mRNA; r:37649-38710